jgi:predicted membrane-bound spermidine synthase
VIVVGGGRDLLSAYICGIHGVTGVELNPIFIDMLTGPFRHYNGLAGLPGIRLFVDEARSWFARTSERFDLIEMSLIDTWAATGAGAFSLSENGLYTVQGWHHFLDALTPTGVFTVSRWYDPMNLAEIGRLLSLAATALRSRGIEQPDAHIFLAGTPVLATLIVANAPFAADDLTSLTAKTEELGFKVLLSPGQPTAAPVLLPLIEENSPD